MNMLGGAELPQKNNNNNNNKQTKNRIPGYATNCARVYLLESFSLSTETQAMKKTWLISDSIDGRRSTFWHNTWVSCTLYMYTYFKMKCQIVINHSPSTCAVCMYSEANVKSWVGRDYIHRKRYMDGQMLCGYKFCSPSSQKMNCPVD